MRVTLIGQGRRLDPGTAALCEEYAKRARSLLPFELVTVTGSAGQWQRARVPGGIVVVLDERGAAWSSPQLAGALADWQRDGRKHVAFLVGGADGFSADDRARADVVLSLSTMTLPHRLAHLVICEQLYRAGTILANHPYHHG